MMYFSPSRFEVPGAFKKKTRVFGMGPKNAAKLADELNAQPPSQEPIVIYGCAGSLSEQKPVGEVFFITHLFRHGEEIELPKHLLPPDTTKTLLVSFDSVVGTPIKKRALRDRTKADLVDCEMLYLWEALKPEHRSRLVFIRGVIDSDKDSVSVFHVMKLFKNWIIYKKSMERFLNLSIA